MARRRRSGVAFWVFLLLLALGVGWASNQAWRLPLLALFDLQQEPAEQQAAPETVAEEPVEEAAAPEQTRVEATTEEQPVVAQPSVEDSATQRSDPEHAAVQQPQAAPPAGQADEQRDEQSETVATDQEPTLSESTGTDQAVTESPDVDTHAAETGEPEIAALEPTESESEGADPAVAPPGDTPDSEQAPQDASPEDSSAVTPSVARVAPSESQVATKPSFDIVRVQPDGRAVIAGRAEPDAEVEVRSGGQVIDRVRASGRGEWVAIPGKPLDPGDQELSAVALREGAAPLESEQVVVIAVPDPAAPASSPTDTAKAPADAGASAQPVAVLMPRDGKGSGRILQAPGRLSAEGTLALMTVSYDQKGEILLSGEAPPGVPVRIYVDNRPAAMVVGDAKGNWSSGLDRSLDPGTYTLRLDQLDASGEPVARIETPFTRVSEPPIAGEVQVDYVVVQPGNSLWRIARRLSGEGMDYVYIYDANQAQIRDPDLIYPGQVFEIPVEFGSAG